VDKRIWMIGLLATLLIAGCSSSQSWTQAQMKARTASASAGPNASVQPTATKFATKPKPLEIVESGYSVVDGAHLQYAFVLRNPNSDFGVQFPVVRVTMRDAAGSVLSTTDVTFRRWLMPSETTTLAQQADVNGVAPARVDFAVVDPGAASKWRTPGQALPMGLGFLRTAGLKVGRTASGVVFKGLVENPNSKGVDDFIVSVVLRDKSGHIVAGYAGTGMDLDAGSKQIFTIESPHDAPAYATAEAYAQPWGD
jgi:eukaryotic-like serine/threonine-protein kinase